MKRVYIDSRHAIQGDPKSFHFELQEQLVLPERAACYIMDVCCPHSFYTLDSSNRYLYIIEVPSGATPHSRRIELDQQNYDVYSLRVELEAKLNGAGKQVSGTFTVTYNVATNSYTIALSADTFKLLSDAYLRTYDGQSDWSVGSGPTIQPAALDSVADTVGIKGSYVQAATHTTGHIDVRNNSTLYLHSSNLGNFNSEGVSGKKTVLAKLPVTTAFGGILVKTHGGLIHDFIDVSRQRLKMIEFSLQDGNGRPVDLQGGNLSFSLLFCEQPYF
jgi:hypothetical protein